jgi:hypothetical protein
MKFFVYAFCLTLITSAHLASAATPRITGYEVERTASGMQASLRAPGMHVWVTESGFTIDAYRVDGTTRTGHVVTGTWVLDGSPRTAALSATAAPNAPRVTAFRGTTAVQRTVTERVTAELAPGVFVAYVIDGGRFRFDLDLPAGMDPRSVRLDLQGADRITSEGAALKIATSIGEIAIDALRVTEQTSGRQIPSGFAVNGGSISFEVAAYDRTQRLLIDPTVYGTYYGGGAADQIAGVKVTSTGDVVVGGTTWSPVIPSTPGGYQAQQAGGQEGFLALMNGALTQVKTFTYLGGGNDDRVRAIEILPTGEVLATGETLSSDFPISQSSAAQIYSASIDGFVVKMKAGLDKMDFGLFINGNKEETPLAIAYDTENNVYICGTTNSTTTFPTTNGYDKTHNGQLDGFLTKISATGTSFAYSTYLGTEADEAFTAVAVEPSGSPFVTGWTRSPNYPTAPRPSMFNPNRRPYDATFNGGNTDAFVTKFGVDGGTLPYSTYWGGNGDDSGAAIYVDELARCYIIGTSTSTNLPVTTGFQPTRSGGVDAMFAGFSDDGKELLNATYFGGTGNERVMYGGRRPGSLDPVFVGSTTSIDLPVVGLGAKSDRAGATDGFLANISFTSNDYTDIIGGNQLDDCTGLAMDANGDWFICGVTSSTNMYTTADAVQTESSGGQDAFVIKIARGLMELATPRAGETLCSGSKNTISWNSQEMRPEDTFSAELSSDGQTWTQVATGLTGNSYQWTPGTSIPPGSNYRLRLRSSRGHLDAMEGTFTISSSPVIATQPTGTTSCAGSPVSLSVGATGAGLKYQWRRNGQQISGATQATYQISALSADNTGRYDVIVTGSCTPQITSSVAEVAMATSTAITKQPVDVSVDAGKSFTLSVAATGAGLSYQWKRDGTDIPAPAGTKATYEVSSAQAFDKGSYLCVVNGTCGTSTSNAVTVTVNDPSSVEKDMDAEWMRIVGPIPAGESVFVTFATPLENVTVVATDMTGRETVLARWTGVGASAAMSVPTDVLESGIYTFTFMAGSNRASFAIPVRR